MCTRQTHSLASPRPPGVFIHRMNIIEIQKGRDVVMQSVSQVRKQVKDLGEWPWGQWRLSSLLSEENKYLMVLMISQSLPPILIYPSCGANVLFLKYSLIERPVMAHSLGHKVQILFHGIQGNANILFNQLLSLFQPLIFYSNVFLQPGNVLNFPPTPFLYSQSSPHSEFS